MLGNLPEGHSLCIEQKIRVPKNHSPLMYANIYCEIYSSFRLCSCFKKLSPLHILNGTVTHEIHKIPILLQVVNLSKYSRPPLQSHSREPKSGGVTV